MPTVVLCCFFLSGASGLILELLWTRMLTLVFGSTALAVSTVLATYMGGLGLGSYLAGKVADRIKNSVRAYALAEAAIGLYALAVPWLIHFYPGLNHWLWATFGDHYTLLSLLRFVASAALLIVPTTLMGATLPLLARYFVSRPFEFGRVSLRLGTLYAVNIFGGVSGCFLAGFIALPLIGVRSTNFLAASFDMSLAAAIVITQRVRRRWPAAPKGPSLDELAAQANPAEVNLVVITPAARRAVLFAFAVSGATAMTLQVLWTRALAVIIGSSIFSFTIILLAFLIGLGTGSAAFGRLAQRFRDPVRSLAMVHLGIVAAIGLSYLVTDRLPYVFTYLLSSTSITADAVLACQFTLACIAVLPSTFLMGAIFPLTVRVVTASLGRVGRDVGSAYALNTVGAIVGSFLSGFVVLPQLGLQKGIYVSAVLDLGLAALLFAVSTSLPRSRRLLGMAAAAGMALLALALPRWNYLHIHREVLPALKAKGVTEVYYTICPVFNAANVAVELGWLHEEFKKVRARGIYLRSLPDNQGWIPHYTHSLPNLFRDGGAIPTIQAKADLADTKLIGLTGTQTGGQILVRAQADIWRVADLKGRKIGLIRSLNQVLAAAATPPTSESATSDAAITPAV